MNVKDKLSSQGLKKVDADIAEDLKTNFIVEINNKNKLTTKGYFIGKTLLAKILRENKDAAGIMISFGMTNKTAKSNGKVQIVVEPASGDSKDDVPVVIESAQKYATSKTLSTVGPDNLTPMIKPNPPH